MSNPKTVERMKALYPLEEYERKNGYTYPGCVCDYDKLVAAFGTIAVQGTDGDYQGDLFYLLERDGRWGFLAFGYGSCSGCDALQGCNSYEELADLSDSMEASVRWFDTLAEAKAYIASINGDDPASPVSWYAHEGGWNDFRAEVEKFEPKEPTDA